MRADKGSADLVRIARAARAQWILRVLGPDRLSAELEVQLKEHGVTCEYPSEGRAPTDDELVRGLLASDLMIAPYRSVTESGSVHMALGLDVPVLAYCSRGLARIVNEKSMSGTADDLGFLLSDYFSGPWHTFTAEAKNLPIESVDTWRLLLDAKF
jgi:hypothetical protein